MNRDPEGQINERSMQVNESGGQYLGFLWELLDGQKVKECAEMKVESKTNRRIFIWEMRRVSEKQQQSENSEAAMAWSEAGREMEASGGWSDFN